MNHEFSIQVFGEECVLLNWPPEIDPDIHQNVVQMDEFICANFQKEISETILGYHSLMVQLKAPYTQQEFLSEIKNITTIEKVQSLGSNYLFRIPVCYNEDYGLDLNQLSEEKQLGISEIIKLHTQPIYPVYFIGFLPGFPYLGGLHEKLYMPRKKEPRTQITAGSVGIGGNQTGIYPLNSPGGWNLIGRTPISLFSKNIQPPALLKAGDRIQFQSIDKNEFARISEAIQKKTYGIEQEVWND